MPQTIPSTRQQTDQNIANIEFALGAVAPIPDKSFVRVMAGMQAMAGTQLYALIVSKAKDCFASTASEEALTEIAHNYSIVRDPALQWRGKATIDIPSDAVLGINTLFVAGPNTYAVEETTAAVVGAVTEFNVICQGTGPAGNLSVGDTLTLQVPVPGWAQTATVSAVVQAGAEEEDLEDFRLKVLDVQRGDLSLGTPASARNFAQAVPGVLRAYAFTEKPVMSPDSAPGDRSVYVKATEDIDPDGIAPQGLLDLVRAALIRDPETAESRIPLGMTVDNLYVQSIVRTPIYITIVGMSIVTGTIGDAQSQVTAALDALLRLYEPFMQGTDSDLDRRDNFAASSAMGEIDRVLFSFGGVVENVTFSLYPAFSPTIGAYQCKDNECLKLGGIQFLST
ncbi:hypothetical protein FACS1894110_10000 [Spirochaetia bacterium]|nr:hypothetical protein FACS1894110_10000 [Spirochaetia bacterium]